MEHVLFRGWMVNFYKMNKQKNPKQARSRSLMSSVNRIGKTAMLQGQRCLFAFVSMCHSNHRSVWDLGADSMLGTGKAKSPWSRD